MKFVISASDVLSGKIDLDSIDATYVLVPIAGMVTSGHLEKLLEAMNYMAKFGWRLCACLGPNCIMEKPGSA